MKLAVFISGTGTNMVAIHNAIKDGALDATIELIVSSNAVSYTHLDVYKRQPLAVVVAQYPRVRHDLFITDGHTGGAHDGDVVLARITSYPDRRQPMQG